MLLELDAGERDDEPEELWRLFDALSVACGGHAGDAASMARVVDACVRGGMAIGAHPAYPDRAGFGRTTMAIAPEALADALDAQLSALAAIARARGASLAHVKPHGALYHDASRDPAIAEAVVAATLRTLGDGVAVIGPPRGALADAARLARLPYWREGFADRGMRPDGSLVPRGEPGALVEDPREAAARAVAFVWRGDVEALCVHGDTPGALAIARAVRAVLDEVRRG